MAYAFTAASSQYLTANSPLTAVPCTLACWVYLNNTTDTMVPLTINSTTGDNRIQLALVSQQVRANLVSGGTGGTPASTTGTYSANVWFHAAGTFESAAVRTAYRDGGNTGSANSLITPSSIGTTVIGAALINGAYSIYTSGLIAECGIWSAALTAEEVRSLSAGMTCDKVRPQSLVFYAPLVRNLQDVRGGLTITNNNTATVAAHPRVYS
jgi:hypothetical protein